MKPFDWSGAPTSLSNVTFLHEARQAGGCGCSGMPRHTRRPAWWGFAFVFNKTAKALDETTDYNLSNLVDDLADEIPRVTEDGSMDLFDLREFD